MVCIRINETELKKVMYMIPNNLITDYILNENYLLFGLYEEDDIIGVSVIQRKSKKVIIEYIYIKEESFNDDTFSELINEISYESFMDGYEILEWNFIERESSALLEMFNRYGFKIENGSGAMFEFKIKDLNINRNTYKNVVSLKDADEILIKNLCKIIVERGEDIVEMPVNKEMYDDECSVVYMDDNKAGAMLLLQEKDNGNLVIPYMFSCSSNAMAIVDMMIFIYQRAKEKYDENTVCTTYIPDLILMKIIEKIIGIESIKSKKAVFDLNVYNEYESEFDFS